MKQPWAGLFPSSSATTTIAPTRQVLTSGTSATYLTPAGCSQLRIRMVGGGGGGSASNANSGGAGGDTSLTA